MKHRNTMLFAAAILAATSLATAVSACHLHAAQTPAELPASDAMTPSALAFCGGLAAALSALAFSMALSRKPYPDHISAMQSEEVKFIHGGLSIIAPETMAAASAELVSRLQKLAMRMPGSDLAGNRLAFIIDANSHAILGRHLSSISPTGYRESFMTGEIQFMGLRILPATMVDPNLPTPPTGIDGGAIINTTIAAIYLKEF